MGGVLLKLALGLSRVAKFGPKFIGLLQIPGGDPRWVESGASAC